jgi:hypothetical protein
MGPAEGGIHEHLEAVDVQQAHTQINQIDRRVRLSSDRWHGVESLIVSLCGGGLLLSGHSRPELGWRWVAAYFVVASFALGIHLWRRRIHRAPPRWHAAVWPATFALLLAASVVLATVVAPGLSLLAVAVAAVPVLPGLTFLAWTLRR